MMLARATTMVMTDYDGDDYEEGEDGDGGRGIHDDDGKVGDDDGNE